MQDPGYYALPLPGLPRDVSHNLNKVTLFSKPNDRLVRLANELLVSNPILVGPTTPSNRLKIGFNVRGLIRLLTEYLQQ